jgi:hypothetical protein
MEDLARIFSFPNPKYTESAPAATAAESDSKDPTGAIRSMSFRLSIFADP